MLITKTSEITNKNNKKLVDANKIIDFNHLIEVVKYVR